MNRIKVQIHAIYLCYWKIDGIQNAIKKYICQISGFEKGWWSKFLLENKSKLNEKENFKICITVLGCNLRC